MPGIILLGYFLTGQVYYFPSEHFHRPESASDTEAGPPASMSQLTFYLGLVFSERYQPLALRKDRAS